MTHPEIVGLLCRAAATFCGSTAPPGYHTGSWSSTPLQLQRVCALPCRWEICRRVVGGLHRRQRVWPRAARAHRTAQCRRPLPAIILGIRWASGPFDAHRTARKVVIARAAAKRTSLGETEGSSGGGSSTSVQTGSSQSQQLLHTPTCAFISMDGGKCALILVDGTW